MAFEMPATKYIEAHFKKCNLCRKHDRRASSGERYTDKELATYKAHIARTLTAIKLAVEDEAIVGKW